MSSNDLSDTLRALGRFLEEDGASELGIVNNQVFLRVTWQGREGAAGDRMFREDEIGKLRAEALALRWGLPDNLGSLQETLRTIGQMIEQDDMDLGSISEDPDGLLITGTIGNRYVNRLVLWDELQPMTAEQRRQRADDDTVNVARPVDILTLVTVGSPVFTLDGHRLGNVKEVKGRSFKIQAPLLQRDYWLVVELVSAAVPKERVDLSIPMQDIAEHKKWDPSP